MAYTKVPAKKRTYKKYNKKVNSFAPKVKRVLYSIAEKKHLEFGNTAQTVNSSWGINSLLCSTTASATDATGSGIVQGAGFNQRIGERIRLNKLAVMFHVLPTSGAVIPANGMTCRFIIVQDKLPNLSYPAITDILETDASVATGYNLTKRDRFKILKDFVHQQVPTISSTTAVLGGGPQTLTRLEFYPKIDIEYTGALGLTNSVFKQNIFLLSFCTGANCTTMVWRNQLEFTDM